MPAYYSSSPRSQSWRLHAQCRGADPDIYDLSGRDYAELDRDQIAADLCTGCPVIRECAADAADPLSVSHVRAGVWVPDLIGQRSARAMQYRALLRSIARTGRPTPRPGAADEGVHA